VTRIVSVTKRALSPWGRLWAVHDPGKVIESPWV